MAAGTAKAGWAHRGAVVRFRARRQAMGWEQLTISSHPNPTRVLYIVGCNEATGRDANST